MWMHTRRGAISDFYAYKQKILDADYDPLCIQVNEDDVFGDGNNFQVCGTSKYAIKLVGQE